VKVAFEIARAKAGHRRPDLGSHTEVKFN
jgi:hypothetical protein